MTGNTLIKAENISKFYRLGTLNATTVKEDIKMWLQKKSRIPIPATDLHPTEHIWALRNINFEVSQGEVLGFIGRNGAGKSTLLKIISRITLPTTGRIRGKGRCASLLEVGTGFHRELTGRENIYLNGHILGMKKKEIDSKFGEIVEFSGVERFLDTPVKRYSSGMYVRLAFAVAAHLDPEILIVDEVLAVGDAEFQKKCIGKMKEVSSKQGKTILFVSHNMQAIRNLCHRAMVLHKGEIIDLGEPEKVIGNYLKSEAAQYLQNEFPDKLSAPGNDSIRIKKIRLKPQYLNDDRLIDVRTPIDIEFEFWYHADAKDKLIAAVQLSNAAGDRIFEIASPGAAYPDGLVSGHCSIPAHFLNDGGYSISIAFIENSSRYLYHYENCISFAVEDYREEGDWYGRWQGYVRPAFPVILKPNGEPTL